MRVKGKQILKNGVVAGYVLQKDGTWKWRFIKGPSKKKGGVNNRLNNNGRLKKLKKKYETNRKEENTELRKKLKNLRESLEQKHLASPKVFGKHDNRVYKQMYKNLDDLLKGTLSDKNIKNKFLTNGRRNRIQRSITKWTEKKANCQTRRCQKQRKASELLHKHLHNIEEVNEENNNIPITKERLTTNNERTNERRTPSVKISKKLFTNNNGNSKQYFENPYITWGDIDETEHILNTKLKIINQDINNVNEQDLVIEERRNEEVSIGDVEQINKLFIEGKGQWINLPKGFIFRYKSIPKTEEAKNGVDLFMRHSIRAKQYFESREIKNFENKYIGHGNELYNIFYPDKGKWIEEPFLCRLGMFLAFAEGIRMCRSGMRIDRIISSPYIRCIQTALMVAIVTGIKTIEINKFLGEKFQSCGINNNYYNKINFYKKCPNKEDKIIYKDITIISDGKVNFNSNKNQKDFFERTNAYLKKRVKGSRENNLENILYVGHNEIKISEGIGGIAYAFIIGINHEKQNIVYNLRGMNNLASQMGY